MKTGLRNGLHGIETEARASGASGDFGSFTSIERLS